MTIITIGIDLAKNIFAVHGVNENGHAELVNPRLAAINYLSLIANLPPCLIGWRACFGAHHWAPVSVTRPHRQIDGIEVRHPLPHERQAWQEARSLYDAADAAAITEAVTRAHMRFVPI